MKAPSLSAALFLWHTFTAAQTTRGVSDDLNTEPPQPQSTACGQINNQNLYHGFSWFEAALAMECLTSVPFNRAVATRFVAWYNQTLQFHSTSAFLKNPPQEYQQPRHDIFAELERIQHRIDADHYHNQYVFDADIYQLIRGAHDEHLDLWAGALPQFSFAAPFQIVSVSKDGREVPKVYFWYDIKHYTENGVVPNPINTMNGVPVIKFLEQYAALQSFDSVDQHADWNNLMRTPAKLINGYRGTFSYGGTFYPGSNNISAIYQNGTNYTVPWVAYYDPPSFTGPLETGGDFYNFFVLGLLPANYDQTYESYSTSGEGDEQTARRSRRDNTPTNPWHGVTTAYPEATISQQDNLGLDAPGSVTGYYLSDISTAIISIPSFASSYYDDDTFEQAIKDFISNATARNAKRIIIDLQQNRGGDVSLAFELSPPATPSRRRSHPLGDYLGQSLTDYFDQEQQIILENDLYDIFVGNEWVATTLIDFDTQQNFTSWQQLRGPLTFNGDTFSRVEEYNLSSAVYAFDALGFDPTPIGNPGQQDPWDAGDIVILTDGQCASSCSLFVEIATQSIGIRTVVVGGGADSTPMQVASGSRGAVMYSSDQIDLDFTIAGIINGANNSAYLNDTGMSITYATVNLRDQIRPQNNVDGVPNQVLYLPANCRIYWTLANFDNYTQLWQDVSDAIYKDQSICVGGYQDTSKNVTASRRRRSMSEISTYVHNGLSAFKDWYTPLPGKIDGEIGPSTFDIKTCRSSLDCNVSGICTNTTVTCQVGCNRRRGGPCPTKKETIQVCAPRMTGHDTCAGGTFLSAKRSSSKEASSFANDRVFGAPKNVTGDSPQRGYCVPNPVGTRACKGR